MTVCGFFRRRPIDWEMPPEGLLIDGPRGICLIVGVRCDNSWNDIRSALGGVHWSLRILYPNGYVGEEPYNAVPGEISEFGRYG